MAVGTASCLMLVWFWDTVNEFDGQKHSVVFLLLTTTLALVDCTSSVLYLPFVAHFEVDYVRPLLVGEGLSGFIPSIASLVQGVGGNPTCEEKWDTLANGTRVRKIVAVYSEPRYSVAAFFGFLTFLMLSSWVAYAAINYFDFANDARVDENRRKPATETTDLNSVIDYTGMSKTRFLFLLTTQSYICGLMNGVIASISTYSTLPYGNLTYHIATNFSVMSGPVAAFLVFSIHRKKKYQKPIIPLTIIGTITSIYIIYVAASSPHTPLQGTNIGSILIVGIWLIYHGSFSYVKVSRAFACIKFKN